MDVAPQPEAPGGKMLLLLRHGKMRPSAKITPDQIIKIARHNDSAAIAKRAELDGILQICSEWEKINLQEWQGKNEFLRGNLNNFTISIYF